MKIHTPLPEPERPAVPTRALLEASLTAHGLRVRGGWRPTASDALPSLPGERSATVVWMVGVVGSEFWPAFKASSFYQDGLPDPLDRWSCAVGSELAQKWGGLALFPFEGPPYHPFQQWATRAEPLQASPLMMRIHPEFGVWHAYRFALALPSMVPGDVPEASPLQGAVGVDLCLTCVGQPCLSACPVQAFTGTGYLLDTCAAHLHTAAGEDCMTAGCLSRRACPVGREHTYLPEHAAFHMQAFTGRH